MRVVSTRSEIRSVADRFRKQYKGYYGKGSCSFAPGGQQDHEDVERRLRALDVDTATPDDVERIIGNSSWVEVRCDECGDACESVVLVGEDNDDPDDRNARVCGRCLGLASYALANRA